MFQVNPLQGADIELGIIDPNSLNLLNVLEGMIRIGSQDQVLATADLQIYLQDNETHDNDLSVSELMSRQNPYIDSVIYRSIPIQRRQDIARLVVPGLLQNDQLKLMYRNASIGAFIAYFYLLSQGRWPAANEQQIPRFIAQILHLNNSIQLQIDSLYRLQPQTLPVEWIRNIQFGQLNIKSRNRLAMGAAGHRLLFALQYKEADNPQGLTQLETRAINFIRQYLTGGICWELHPLFRPAIFFTRFASLTDDLQHLIQRKFRIETINQMVQQKVLFAAPNPNPQKIRFHTWPDNPFDFCVNRIFANNQQQNIQQGAGGNDGGQGPPNQGQGGNQPGQGGNQPGQGGNQNQGGQGGNQPGDNNQGGGRQIQQQQQQQQPRQQQQQQQVQQRHEIMPDRTRIQNPPNLQQQIPRQQQPQLQQQQQRQQQQQIPSQQQPLSNDRQLITMEQVNLERFQGLVRQQEQLQQANQLAPIQQQQTQIMQPRQVDIQQIQRPTDQTQQTITNLRTIEQVPFQPRLLYEIKTPVQLNIEQGSRRQSLLSQQSNEQPQQMVLRQTNQQQQSDQPLQPCGHNHADSFYCEHCIEIETAAIQQSNLTTINESTNQEQIQEPTEQQQQTHQ